MRVFAAVALLAAAPAVVQAAPGDTSPPASSAAPAPAPLDLRVLRWTTAEGLPQNTINDIAVLPNGELWLATFGGLARFDGHRFQVLDIASEPGLPSNRITALVPAEGDALWFVTQEGHLGRIDAGRARTLVPPATALHEMVGLTTDPRGTIFGQANDGSVWRTDGRTRWQQVIEGSTGGAPFKSAALTESGEGWVPRSGGLVRFDSGADGGDLFPLGRPAQALAPRPGGGLWVGVGPDVARLVDGRLQRLSVQPAFTAAVTTIEPAGPDRLWVASQGEVSRLDRQSDGSWSRRLVALGLAPGFWVRSLAVDADGTLWIGTGGLGLYHASQMPVRRIGAGSGLSGVTALAPDGRGGAWVTGGCSGLFHLGADGTASRVLLHPPTEGGCEFGLTLDRARRLWVRAERRLYRVDRPGATPWRAPLDLPKEAGPVVAEPGGSMWVISRGGTVHRVSAAGALEERRELPGPLFAGTLAPDGALWVGGEGVVFRMAGGQVQRLATADGVPRGAVRDLRIEPDGTIWIATYGGGLGYLKDGRAVRITVAEGLPDNALSRVLDDGRGRMWLSTNRGIAIVERSALQAVVDGRERLFVPVVMGPERGVPEANFGSPAGCADDRGALWFGTIDGVVRIEASRFPFNTRPPVVRVEGVSADNQPLPVGTVVQIPARTERVRVAFTAPSLRYPDRMRFRFRIEGVDQDWVDVGAQRFASWTPAGPGLHRFVVEARNEDGVWSAAPTAIDLQVLPAWWQTALARAGGAVLLVVAAFVLYRLRVGSIERRHAARVRELEERRRAEEHAAALRVQLEHVSRVALAGELAASLAHEVNQPLAAIVNNAEAGRRILALPTADPADLSEIFSDIAAQGLRASEVVRGLRGFLRSGEGAATPIDLSALVREMLPLVRRELEDNRVEVELALATGLPPIDGFRVQLGQIVLNLLMNACEALSDVDGRRRITVTTRAEGSGVQLVVDDTGPGFAADVAGRAFDPFVTTKPEGMGMGLAISRSIAEAHGGRLRAEAAPGGGARVVLDVPVSAGVQDPGPPLAARAAAQA